jgi:nucleoside-diphosphate-sugar epimerase
MSQGKSRVLITGGAGYIGSVLTRVLLEQGHAVTVVDNFMFRQTSLLDCCRFETFDVVRGDARDERTMAPLVSRHDVIIPLAALVGAPLCDLDRVAATTTNVEAVRLLCRLASREQRILFPVTNSGYGIGDADTMCTEESPLRPVSLYGETKVEAERIVLDRGESITFRLATVFGASPRMRLDLLVNDFVYRAVTDRSLVLFESHFKRNFIHVQDVVRVFVHGLAQFDEMKGRPYNVGLDSANLSKWQLCERIQAHVPGFVFFEAPIGQDPDKRDYIVSNARIASTGFETAWTLDDGIRELMRTYRIVRRSQHGNV